MEDIVKLLLSMDQKTHRVYGHLVQEAKEIAFRYQGRPERWKNNPLFGKALEELLKRFRNRLCLLILSSIQSAQVLAHREVDALLKRYRHCAPSGGLIVLEEVKIKLSSRIWDLSRLNGKLIERYVKHGVKEGASASEMTRDLRRFLKQPDKLFRRIKNEKGQLELSEAAREYHPGRGVYRSSYKNALRLSRTEINMAYHRAQYERWRKLPFVLGVEVRLSRVHKEGACICDHLQGKYPKNFLFLGWHPQCLCQAVPVLLSREEFLEYNKTGKIDPSRHIREIPKKAQEYLDEHAEQIRGWKNRPYFIADNFKYIEGKGFIYKGL